MYKTSREKKIECAYGTDTKVKICITCSYCEEKSLVDIIRGNDGDYLFKCRFGNFDVDASGTCNKYQ